MRVALSLGRASFARLVWLVLRSSCGLFCAACAQVVRCCPLRTFVFRQYLRARPSHPQHPFHVTLFFKPTLENRVSPTVYMKLPTCGTYLPITIRQPLEIMVRTRSFAHRPLCATSLDLASREEPRQMSSQPSQAVHCSHGRNYKVHLELAARLSLLDPKPGSQQQWRSVVDERSKHLTFGASGGPNTLDESQPLQDGHVKFLVCPFLKHNAEKYQTSCGAGQWRTVHRLK